jgi:hypothetical protein
MSRSDLAASLKGKYGLARGPFANAILQRLCRGEVHRHVQDVSEAIFQRHHIQQGKLPGRIKLRHQIDIRFGRIVAARLRAEQGEVLDAGAFQLRFVFPKFRFLNLHS